MNVSYRGVHQELPPKIQGKLDAKFAKLSKLLEKRGEKEAHVVVTNERHLHHAEVTLNFYDHQLVGIGSDADLFTALSEALDKLETQALKQRTKWREKRRRSDNGEPEVEPVAVAASSETERGVRVFPVNHYDLRKPMTLPEALIELETETDRLYLAYRDAEKECVSVLVRRGDGDFDLIES
jgi:putative sigma-54 modulation protein